MNMALRLIRSICFTIFILGIPGLIVSSIAGNNEGWVLTIGMVMVGAAIVLMALSATGTSKRIDVFTDVMAERVEQRARVLIEAGADEVEVRSLIRETIEMVRGQQ